LGCGTTPLYREDPCGTAAAADGCDVTACSSAGEGETSPLAGAAASGGCWAAPDSVVAVDAPVEREEAEEASAAAAAVGLMLSTTIPMMSYSSNSVLPWPVSLCALISSLWFLGVCALLLCVLCSLQLAAASAACLL